MTPVRRPRVQGKPPLRATPSQAKFSNIKFDSDTWNWLVDTSITTQRPIGWLVNQLVRAQARGGALNINQLSFFPEEPVRAQK